MVAYLGTSGCGQAAKLVIALPGLGTGVQAKAVSRCLNFTVPSPMWARPALCSLGYEGARELNVKAEGLGTGRTERTRSPKFLPIRLQLPSAA